MISREVPDRQGTQCDLQTPASESTLSLHHHGLCDFSQVTQPLWALACFSTSGHSHGAGSPAGVRFAASQARRWLRAHLGLPGGGQLRRALSPSTPLSLLSLSLLATEFSPSASASLVLPHCSILPANFQIKVTLSHVPETTRAILWGPLSLSKLSWKELGVFQGPLAADGQHCPRLHLGLSPGG